MYRHSGIGRYLRNLFPLLLPQLSADQVRVLGRRDVIGDAGWCADRRVEFQEEPSRIYSVSEQMMGIKGSYRDSDLLWVPHFNVPLFYGGRMVVTVHDIAPVVMPGILGNKIKRAYAALLIQRAVERAAEIMCVSEFTATELHERLGVAREKIIVTYPGLEAGWPEQATPHREADGLPYVLFVGNVKPNKNLSVLLRAFAKVKDVVPYRLVLVGRMRGFGTEDELSLRRAEVLGDRVRFTNEISDEELISLYAGASAFCLPSLYEGFGLPLLEAMRLGCPVLCSNAGALPEVAADAALYFDPRDDEALARCLLQVTDTWLMDRLRQAGRRRVEQFSFTRCAELTAEVLNRTMAASPGVRAAEAI
jgi:glycosyltransferase involved in cell wall biosynthesis